MLENSFEKFPSIISNGVLDEREVTFPEWELSSNPFHEEKHYEDRIDCVQNKQEKRTLSNRCITDKKCDSKDLPFIKDHKKLDDSLKAKHGIDIKNCINLVEEISISCRNGSIIFRKSELLHDENCVFDRGKKYCSLCWGVGAT